MLRNAHAPVNARPRDGSEAGYTLVIEASTSAGSVALFRGDLLAQHVTCLMGASRTDALFPAVQTVLAAAAMSPRALGAIVCGSGPGSFTSLRIAAAVAKGLAHATGAQLFAVPSLLLGAAAHDRAGAFVVHADALRGERYAMRVTIDDRGSVQANSEVLRMSLESLGALTTEWPELVVPGETVTMGTTRVVPDAAHLMRVAGWRQQGAVTLDQWEPAYGRLAEAQVKWETTHQRALPPNG